MRFCSGGPDCSIDNSSEFIPKQLIEYYEHELSQYVRRFLEVLLVKTRLAGEELLELRVKLIPADGDECGVLPEGLRHIIRECREVCGFYNPDLRELVFYLGCFIRPTVVGSSLSILRRDYTFFHLIVHHLQAGDFNLARFNLPVGQRYDLQQDFLEFTRYAVEVEADYVARVFSFLSEEERLEPLHGNKYLPYLWPLLDKALWNMVRVCREVEKQEGFKPLSPLDIRAVCYNPFRWLMSRVTGLLRKMSNIVEASLPGNVFKALLLNPLRVNVKAPIESMYIGEKSVCFGYRGGRLYLCYIGEIYDKIRVYGFKLDFTSGVNVNLGDLTGITVVFNPPKAIVEFTQSNGKYTVEARLVYTSSLPRPGNPVSTTTELEELLNLISTTPQPLVPYCDVEKSLLTIPLPRVKPPTRTPHRELVLELGETIVVVDENTCIRVGTQHV